jgi:hypothetical protein
VRALFAEFETTGEATIIGQLVDSLKAHDDADHAALYPFAGRLLGDEALVRRSAAAHSAVKKQIDAPTTLEGTPLIAAVSGLRNWSTSMLPTKRRASSPR